MEHLLFATQKSRSSLTKVDKVADFERFKVYVKKKDEMNRRLSEPRVQPVSIFWTLKLGGYMRHQITEARLLEWFEKLSGSGANNTVVAIGIGARGSTARFNEPIKGKGFRTVFMFREAGDDVYLVDEFRTSISRCSVCEWGECKGPPRFLPSKAQKLDQWWCDVGSTYPHNHDLY